MAWKGQGGGPWGGGGSGGGGGGQGPWGGRGPSGPQTPDIEEILRRSQDRFKRALPGGFGSGKLVLLAVLAAAGLWMASGFYRVDPGEQGVELLFGKFVKVTTPGLNYWFPAPIGAIFKPNVERTNQIVIGFRGSGDSTAIRDVPQESLMLTGDQNIIDIDFVVQWRIKDAAEYLFNIRDPESTVKAAAESAIREVVGQMSLESALTAKRQEVESDGKELLQKILDGYKIGVLIADLKLQKVDPPAQVIDAFNDVQRARQDMERKQNEAQAYANDILPKAKGEAQRQIQEAMAYKEALVAEAQGEANRFLSVYKAYLQNKDVTVKRLYLERMQQVLRDSDKVLIDRQSGGSGVVPYLPLPELKKRAEDKAKASGAAK